jgi:hypothetical protein
VFMVLWGLGAGSASACRLGRWLQSSIRSRCADQGVVRCQGVQSRPAAVLLSFEGRPDTGASSPWLAPRALVGSASLWWVGGSHAASASSSLMSLGWRVRQRISPSRKP